MGLNNQDSRVSNSERISTGVFHRADAGASEHLYPLCPIVPQRRARICFFGGCRFVVPHGKSYGKISRAMQFLPASESTLVQRERLSTPFLNKLQLFWNSVD